MVRTGLINGLWVLTIGLWLAALTATIFAASGNDLNPVVFVITKPVVTALAATLSIGLIAWQLTRPMVKASTIWTVAYTHGRADGQKNPAAAPESDTGNVRQIRKLL